MLRVAARSPRCRRAAVTNAACWCAEYAGYQVKLALEEAKLGTNSSFNALAYSIGFGAHVTGDVAGFYPNAYAWRWPAPRAELCPAHVPNSQSRAMPRPAGTLAMATRRMVPRGATGFPCGSS